MSTSIVFLLPNRKEKGIIDLEAQRDTNTDTNNVNSNRIILDSYTNTSNGCIAAVTEQIGSGRNPAFVLPD